MKKNLGIFITILAGILWGFSGTCGQYIFERFPIEPAHLTAIRILSAGIILLCIGFITSKEDMLKIRTSKKDMARVIIFGVFGVMFSSLTYMTAISYTNSGTATILQYTGPVLVMIISCFMTHKLPSSKEVLAVILALVGTFFIATHGDISTMVINTPGLVWGLLSAVALALYTLIPGGLAEKYGSIPITSYGMISGGITLFILSGAWNAQISIDYRFFLAFGAIVLCGTVLTYSLYLKGLTMIGPVRASMIASVEPVAAAVFMVVWLGAPFHYMDFAGFTCILATVFLLVKKE